MYFITNHLYVKLKQNKTIYSHYSMVHFVILQLSFITCGGIFGLVNILK